MSYFDFFRSIPILFVASSVLILILSLFFLCGEEMFFSYIKGFSVFCYLAIVVISYFSHKIKSTAEYASVITSADPVSLFSIRFFEAPMASLMIFAYVPIGMYFLVGILSLPTVSQAEN